MKNLDYGIIGNCKSAALISKKGSIDWCCLPYFNSASVFAKILDKNIGGSFHLEFREDYTITQQYLNETNILKTRFSFKENVFELIDFMPRYKEKERNIYSPPDLIRFFRYISGKPSFTIHYDPRPLYAKQEVDSFIQEDYIKTFTKQGDYDSLYLYTDLDKLKILKKEPIVLTENAFALVSYNQKIRSQNVSRQYVKMQKTKVYWLNFSHELTLKRSPFYDAALRSALVLKLLTYDKTGAVLAAATTSLPESIGEVRNWDYRFCWIRDASMTVKVMTTLGLNNTAKRFMNFIVDLIPDKKERLQIMYGINKEKILTEETLDHLSGYEGSKPVRIGNAAYIQKQNDIYGILMDVIFQQFEITQGKVNNDESLWTIVRNIIQIVEDHWQEPDKGIWEIRTESKHFTFSKVLCWVAVDRAIKIAEIINKTHYSHLWHDLASKIKKDILDNAWNDEKQSFTQSYCGTALDASNLLMGSYGFLEATDEKYISTVKATQKELCQDGLMYRYKNEDDFGLPSSSFTICTFWMINSLLYVGEEKEAIKMYENLLSYSNHLGLFSEDIDFKTKRLLGNFPQAYSHLALIEIAQRINK